MPACFQLIRKSAPEAGPVAFTTIDEDMCAEFLTKCDPVEWYAGWYDIIGFRLACGSTFEQITKEFRDNDSGNYDIYGDLLPVVEWLDKNFTSNAFHQSSSARFDNDPVEDED